MNNNSINNVNNVNNAVSYTHLDVYKRQVCGFFKDLKLTTDLISTLEDE